MTQTGLWLIMLLPLICGALIALGYAFFCKKPALSGYLGIAGVGGSLLLSIWGLTGLLGKEGASHYASGFSWFSIGNSVDISLNLNFDPLAAIMCFVILFVSLMVHIYSQGYMHGDKGYPRYYAFLSFFTASMLGLVLSDNLLFTFFFWELVGLASYLLIGFWFTRPAAANAAKKAFIVTRIGDVGFLAAILILFANTGTLDINSLNGMAEMGLIGAGTVTVAALGIFAGAVGKSAQFPLHVWLPDAMEGPTPVSALIHAATMVAAGVFLVARTYPIFESSATAMLWVSIIGAVTAIFAATMALVMNDMKRILAYSTVSQLGYMMLGLGTGGIAIGIFHLFNHAFFKSLLFLGSGSVNHATGTFDIREMGGLSKPMPVTSKTFLIASLSLAGIWPLSGFFSKDEILAGAMDGQFILFILALITVFLTAFYMFRLYFVAFGGTYRGKGHPHESPKVMSWPLLILVVPSVISGLLNAGGSFSGFLGEEVHTGFFEGLFGILLHPLALVSLAVAGGGIYLAFLMYKKKSLSPAVFSERFKWLYMIFSKKYWMDELYEGVISRTLLMKGLFAFAAFFDKKVVDGGLNGFLIQKVLFSRLFSRFRTADERIVDGAVNGVAAITVESGKVGRKAQTGQLQSYGIYLAAGVVVLVMAALIIW
ncbi:NADH-quinone oxidoreductase subunit L [Dehalococcoides mccartyi]|uniref:NADH-quinone oxidoreductase subunit L n=1 Tax=Dehalococcoides mccartyi TaxID=61435 RepID=A0AB33HQ88_9CHLR|nr:NADH-quinone oxidoreductase subunit L [Dehalococcoides mccartyi]POZ59022.1 NADH-ubiquinone oxidoreductase chain L [Dehalococcoides mccartyi]BAZ97389.1 NADH-quinone oxidoreductase subunit L [Dehalococcoides mccartyi]